MQIITPDYYEQFKCIAGACKDTCCAGWQVDVDDRSYAYYKTVGGAFGERLHSVMVDGKKGAEGQFRIRENGRCPFLNDDNLCDLYAELGEDALCVTCDQYPRFLCEFGNKKEIGIALSCITAGELILGQKSKASFVEHVDEDQFFSLNEIDGTLYLSLVRARQKAYEIAMNDELEIRERMVNLLYFAEQVQDVIKSPAKIDELCTSYVTHKGIQEYSEHSESFRKIWRYYLKQVLIKQEWIDYYKASLMMYEQGNYAKKISVIADNSKEFENILVYFLYRYFLKGVFDKDVLTKVKMAVISTMMIIHCDMALAVSLGRELDFDERVDVAHIYSREVEHSEENFANLCKMFAKKKLFSVENLAKII